MIENKILSLVKLADPEDPVKYAIDIVKKYAIEKINTSIKSCNKCDLCNHGTKSILMGDCNSKILMISESISEMQYNKGQAINGVLLDEDGETLDRALSVIKANKNSIFFVNSVNCYPAKNIANKLVKRIPSVKERTMCKTYLDKAIKAIEPDVIITLGSVSTNALSSEKVSIIEGRGKQFTYNGYTVVPTFHPGFFREMQTKFDEEIMNMYKDNFLVDLYNAFAIAKDKDVNCKIGDIELPF